MDCASSALCLLFVDRGLGFPANRHRAGVGGYIAIWTCRGSPRVGNRGMRCGGFTGPFVPELPPLFGSQREGGPRENGICGTLRQEKTWIVLEACMSRVNGDGSGLLPHQKAK
ncbi:hypothetical protein U1Q18_005094 [Sarracenia purpurea var. burkii]